MLTAVASVSVVIGIFYGVALGFTPFTIGFRKIMEQAIIHDCFGSMGNNSTTNSPAGTAAHPNSILYTMQPWRDIEIGLFATMLIIGAMMMSPFSGSMADVIGRRKPLSMGAILTLVGNAMSMLAWRYDSLALMDCSRVIVGVATGIVTVVGPMYVGEMAPIEKQSWLNMSFTLGIQWSLAVVAAFGYGIEQHANSYLSQTVCVSPCNVECLEQRYQSWLLFPLVGFLCSLALLATCYFIPESSFFSGAQMTIEIHENNNVSSPAKCATVLDAQQSAVRINEKTPLVAGEADSHSVVPRTRSSSHTVSRSSSEMETPSSTAEALSCPLSDELQGEDTVTEVVAPIDEASLSEDPKLNFFDQAQPLPFLQIVKFGMVILCLGASLQLTGINAVMNYAPHIMSSFNFEPILGNLVFASAAAVFTTLALPLSFVTQVSSSSLYVIGCLGCGACCCLTGLMLYPGIVSATASNVAEGFGLVGIAGLCFFWNGLVCSKFYFLAQAVFPPRIRTRACSLTLNVQFVFFLVIVLCFPVFSSSVEEPAADHGKKAISLAFLFFAIASVVLGFVLAGLKLNTSW